MSLSNRGNAGAAVLRPRIKCEGLQVQHDGGSASRSRAYHLKASENQSPLGWRGTARVGLSARSAAAGSADARRRDRPRQGALGQRLAATVARRRSNSRCASASNSASSWPPPWAADVHDAVALGLELREQARQRARGRGLDVVEQDDALPRPRQVGHHLAMHGAGVTRAVVLAVDVDGEDGDAAAPAGASSCDLVSAQVGKAEERRDRLAQRLLHGAEAELDLVARLVGRRAPAGWRATRYACRRCARGARIRAPSPGRRPPCARP